MRRTGPGRFPPLRCLAACLALSACGGPSDSGDSTASRSRTASSSAPATASEPAKTTVTLSGSSTVAPLMAEIGKRYENLHPGVRIDVQSGGSSRGVSDARSGLADIGMVSRALNADENDLLAFAIANDGVALIVHKDNPVTALGDGQVVGIYTGKTLDWKDAGGNPGGIVVVNKAEGRSTLELFLHHFNLKSAEVKASVVIGENEQAIKTVAGAPGAIGYVSIGSAETAVKNEVPIKILPMGGVESSTAAVANGTYPLSRPLNLVTKGEPTGLVNDLIDFARTPAVRDIVEELSFVPLQ